MKSHLWNTKGGFVLELEETVKDKHISVSCVEDGEPRVSIDICDDEFFCTNMEDVTGLPSTMEDVKALDKTFYSKVIKKIKQFKRDMGCYSYPCAVLPKELLPF